jgi:hypothetical protein
MRRMGSFLFTAISFGLGVLLSFHHAQAVPSFARQTGMSCTTCHMVFPELTPFGRTFKLGGYTFSKSSGRYEYPPPFAGATKVSFTETRGLKNRIDPFDDSPQAKFNLPQSASLYYAGRIIDKLGAFVELAYDGVTNDVAVDMTDIRYANSLTLGSTDLVYGLTVNNSPTLEDAWNGTPANGFPYGTSSVAPTPAAGVIVDGVLDQQVGGLGAYGYWNDLIYAGATLYRTNRKGITRPLGAGTEAATVVDDAAPYWRLALQHQWKDHSFSLGTYGLVAKIFPVGYTHGKTDRFTDVALDAQYQYTAGKHLISAESTWIHEKQDRDASLDLGGAAHHSDFLTTFQAHLNYYFRGRWGVLGGTFGYFSTVGRKDSLLYSPARVSGSQNGKPDSNGFILEADYLPLEKVKVSLQYIIYDRFNGAHSNYDGFGRNASDNNTLYLSVWLLL